MLWYFRQVYSPTPKKEYDKVFEFAVESGKITFGRQGRLSAGIAVTELRNEVQVSFGLEGGGHVFYTFPLKYN